MTIYLDNKQGEEVRKINSNYQRDFRDFPSKREMIVFINKAYDESRCEACGSMRFVAEGITAHWHRTKVIAEERRTGLLGGVKSRQLCEYFTVDKVIGADGMFGGSKCRCKSCGHKEKGRNCLYMIEHDYLDLETMGLDHRACVKYLKKQGEQGTTQFCNTVLRPYMGGNDKADSAIGFLGHLLWTDAQKDPAAHEALNGFAVIAMLLKRLDHENLMRIDAVNPFLAYKG